MPPPRTANTARSRSLAATRPWPCLVLTKLLRQCRFWKTWRREIQISRKLVLDDSTQYGCIPVTMHAIVKRSVHCLVSLCFIYHQKPHCCCPCWQDRHTTKTYPSSNDHGSVENDLTGKENRLCLGPIFLKHFPSGF